MVQWKGIKTMNQNLILAKKCRELRQSKGISLKKWAHYLGLKSEQVVEFEKGVTIIPTLVLVEYAKLKKRMENK